MDFEGWGVTPSPSSSSKGRLVATLCGLVPPTNPLGSDSALSGPKALAEGFRFEGRGALASQNDRKPKGLESFSVGSSPNGGMSTWLWAWEENQGSIPRCVKIFLATLKLTYEMTKRQRHVNQWHWNMFKLFSSLFLLPFSRYSEHWIGTKRITILEFQKRDHSFQSGLPVFCAENGHQ